MASARHRDPDLPRQLGGQPVKLQRAQQADDGCGTLLATVTRPSCSELRCLEDVQPARCSLQLAAGCHACQDHARHTRIGQIARAQHPFLRTSCSTLWCG